MYKIDSQGYLLNFSDWDENFAIQTAKNENIELTKLHWEVIHFVQHFYREYNTSPAIRLLVKSLQKEWGIEKGNSRYLQKLFPEGAAKQATKIAGLPKPVNCI